MLQPEDSEPGMEEALLMLWAAEAQDRLAAYERGELGSSPLSEVLLKYPNVHSLEF